LPGIKKRTGADGKLEVVVSQSWLNTYLECAESARRQFHEPDVDDTNEQHAIGTAMHTYAAARLNGADESEARAKARAELVAAWRTIKKVKIKTFDTAWRTAQEAIACWEQYIFPVIDPDLIEETLSAVIIEGPDVRVIVEGTPDLYDMSRCMWDWKTTSQMWEWREHAKWDIQPTVYYFLLKENGYNPNGNFVYFVYNKKTKTHQIIDCHRNDSDVAWLRHQIEQAVSQLINYSDQEWALNNQSWLCSDRWCPWYQTCRGGAQPGSSDAAKVTIVRKSF
jgi:hypothetical protein